MFDIVPMGILIMSVGGDYICGGGSSVSFLW